MASPKWVYTEMKTDRKYKGQENVEITPFDATNAKYGRVFMDSRMKVLGPTIRNNVMVEEPKRPKILSKQKQLTFF